MGVHKGSYDLHREGGRDAQRHQEKLKEAFRKKLHDIISEENIITSDGNKKIKVPIRSLDQYRFIFDRKREKQTGQGDGDTEVGDIVGREHRRGDGPGAGNEDGEEYYEAEIFLDDLVEMMMEDLQLPRLDPKKKADLTVPETEWNEVSKRGTLSNIHKKRTIIENMKRNAKRTGKAYFGDVINDDLRYKSWNTIHKPITSAVIFAMMDTSASMYAEKKYIARAFYFWMVQFLRKKYMEVDIVFISHTTTAKVCTEDEFFHRTESGGTFVSSAYQMALDLIEKKYDPNIWNIFAFHFSDGETWGTDEIKCVELIQKLLIPCNMVGYGEINTMEEDSNWTTLYKTFEEKIKDEKFVMSILNDKKDVYRVLQEFFSGEIE